MSILVLMPVGTEDIVLPDGRCSEHKSPAEWLQRAHLPEEAKEAVILSNNTFYPPEYRGWWKKVEGEWVFDSPPAT